MRGSSFLLGIYLLVTTATLSLAGPYYGPYSFNGTIQMPGLHTEISTFTTSETRYIVPYVGQSITITGFYQRAGALITAGTFAVKRNGVTIQGLGAIVPSLSGSLTVPTTSTNNICSAGDQITIVANGTLSGILRFGVSVLFTARY